MRAAEAARHGRARPCPGTPRTGSSGKGCSDAPRHSCRGASPPLSHWQGCGGLLSESSPRRVACSPCFPALLLCLSPPFLPPFLPPALSLALALYLSESLLPPFGRGGPGIRMDASFSVHTLCCRPRLGLAAASALFVAVQCLPGLSARRHSRRNPLAQGPDAPAAGSDRLLLSRL